MSMLIIFNETAAADAIIHILHAFLTNRWHLEAAKSATYAVIHIFANVFDDQIARGS